MARENSPGLSRIENPWAIVQESDDSDGTGTFDGNLADGVRAAWFSISSKMLNSLVSNMLHHMLGSIREKGIHM